MRVKGIADGPSRLLMHLRWAVADPVAAPLTSEAQTRLPSYVLRYAETLGACVHAVGGIEDHLHILLDIPPTKALQGIEDELRRASQRFVRDVLGQRTFCWEESVKLYTSVSPSEQEVIADYLRQQTECHASGDLREELEVTVVTIVGEGQATEDEVPEWLRSALRKQS